MLLGKEKGKTEPESENYLVQKKLRKKEQERRCKEEKEIRDKRKTSN